VNAVVVGAGPNGLAGAVELARNGLEVTLLEAEATIGGGTRSEVIDGVLVDHCSATHPMAVESPALRGLEIEWRWPELSLAHPLDDGTAAVMQRSLDATAAGLGPDGRRWRLLFGAGFPTEDLLGPVLHVPKHPLRLVRFGLPTLPPPTLTARAFRTEAARALFGGSAAHAINRLDRPLSGAIGCALIAANHAFGWPVARGGSRAITDALAAELARLGGRIETGQRVTALPDADVVLLDLTPGAAADIAGDRMPARVARAYRRYRHGPGAYKVDLAVEGGVPWVAEACRRAGNVHAIGSWGEIVRAEADIAAGRMPERPFVLVGQQYLADPERSNGDVHPVWSYAHVPHGYDGDATDAVIAQIERYAPGLRERIVATHVRGPRDWPAFNANCVGGDIINGASTPRQIAVRPRLAANPYATGIPGVYLCSAATPPGAGAHGMSGYLAARAALR
jgi:phytoene dehydrogenase-like protein